jgi:hypothetical protein
MPLKIVFNCILFMVNELRHLIIFINYLLNIINHVFEMHQNNITQLVYRSCHLSHEVCRLYIIRILSLHFFLSLKLDSVSLLLFYVQSAYP